MSETEERARVVAEARRWVRTPYHTNADVMGAGVDCGMLLVRVFVDTGLVEPFDPRPYPTDWHMHRSEERYLGFVTGRSRQVEEPGLGDIVLFRFGRCYSHGGIVTGLGPVRIVHAHMPARMVLEEILSKCPELSLHGRTPHYYSVWPRS